MASLVVAGDTSGSVTLAAPAVAGSTTLTLPTTTGTLVVTGGAQTVQFAAGTVSAPSITTTGDTNTGIFFPAADTIAFTEGGVEAMRIDSSGNVGIGTSSPSEKLSVTGNVTATGTNTSATYFHRSIAPATESNIETSLITTGNGANQRAGLFATNDYNNTLATELIFKTNATTGGATERMRINSAGQIAWGTSSIDGYLTLTWAGQTYVGFVMNNTDAFGTSTNIRFKNNGTTVGEIASTTTTTSYNTSSDYRLKENIATMTGALAKVAQLKPVTYTWKANGEASQGFIAHELQAVVPDCVTGEKDAVELVDVKDEEGNVIGQEEKPVYQGVDTSFLVATLTAAIQELNAKVEAQAAEIAALKGAN